MSQLCPGNLSRLTARLPLQIAILGVIALFLMLFLAACGGDDEPAAVEPTPVPAEATSPPPAPTEPPTAPPTSAPTEAATGAGAGTASATSTPRPAPTAAPAITAVAPVATEEPAASGGVLRVGAAGWANDQFNPFFAQSLAEYVGLWNVYDAIAWRKAQI